MLLKTPGSIPLSLFFIFINAFITAVFPQQITLDNIY